MDNIKEIVFPAQCDLDDVFLNIELLQLLKEIYLKDFKVVFNCEGIQFIRPAVINLLSASIYYQLYKRKEAFIKLPKNNFVYQYLKDVGFFQEFNIEGDKIHSHPRSTSIALKRLANIDGTYLESITFWLNNNGGIPLNSARDFVSINLVEAINNVFDHSKSKIGCYISAQAYHKEDRVILSVIDLGIGFYNSLSPYYKDIDSDEKAISKAVSAGISSKRNLEGRVRGIGLSNISDFLKNRGEFTIVSYKGYWKQKRNGKIETKLLSVPFCGTCLNMDIDKFSIYDIIDKDEEIWE